MGCAFAAAQQLLGVIVLAAPDYTIQGWHGTLITIAIVLLAIFFNTVLVRKLPLTEGLIMILHTFGFFAVVIVLWVMGPLSDAHTVFTQFEDNAGWGSKFGACLVGIIGPMIILTGGDSACHLSEELKDAARILPRAMLFGAVFNYVFGFVMTIALMFTVGDVVTVLATPTGQPYIAVVQNATEARGGTITLVLVVFINIVFSAVNQVTTSSRQLFAFSRDRGLPFSDFLSRVRLTCPFPGFPDIEH